MDNSSSQTKSSKLIHIIMYFLLVVLLAASLFVNYIYYNDHGNPMDHKEKSMNFGDLPGNIKGLYVRKSQHVTLTESFAMLKLEQEALTVKMANMKTTAVMDTVKEQKPLTVTVTKNASMSKDSMQCSNMNSGGYELSSTCKQNIIDYVDRHPDAKYFEIIGIVDNFEFKLFSNLKKNSFIHKKLGLSNDTLKTMKKYTQMGLAKYRANEASWVIKSYTKREAQTYSSHYKLVSNKGSRGVVIRAYE